MTKLTDKQRDAIDKTLLEHIRTNSGVRTMDLLKVPKIRKVLNSLPPGKEDFRYLDNALQRLRKAGLITAIANRWSAFKERLCN